MNGVQSELMEKVLNSKEGGETGNSKMMGETGESK